MPEISNTNGFRGISFGVKAVLVTLVPVAGLGVTKLLLWLVTNPRAFLYLWGIALAIGLLSEHYIREWRNNNTEADNSEIENRTVIVTSITEEPRASISIAHENPTADSIIPNDSLKQKTPEIPFPLEDDVNRRNNNLKHQKKTEIIFPSEEVSTPKDYLKHQKKPEVRVPPEELVYTPVQRVSTKIISLFQTTSTGDEIPPKDLSQATARTLDLESFMKPMTDEGDTAKSNKGATKRLPMDVNKNYTPEMEWGSKNSVSSPQSEMNILFSGMSKLKDDESTDAMKS